MSVLLQDTTKSSQFNTTRKTKEAINTYSTNFCIRKCNGYTYLKIGLCYKELSSYKQAIRYFTKACHEDPQLSEAWMEIGLCYEATGSIEEAITSKKQ